METNSRASVSTSSCTSSPLEATRFVAWVSVAGAIVWGVSLAVCSSSVSNDGSSSIWLFLLYATVLHVGQAIASAISFQLGTLFAAITVVFVALIAIGNTDDIALLTTPFTVSSCALLIARRCSGSSHHENVE